MDKMTLNDLLKILLEKLPYDFEVVEYFGEDAIMVMGLKKGDEITIKIRNYAPCRIIVSTMSKRLQSGTGCPCDNVDIAVKRLVDMDTIFGYEIPKRKPKQLSLF